MYHGWADPLVTPDASLIMYKRINDAVGAAAANSLALFMVPGMGHWQGGLAPTSSIRWPRSIGGSSQAPGRSRFWLLT